MSSVLLLGSRGCGTSIVAGLLASAGLRAQDSPERTLEAPFGRLELGELRALNDALLAPHVVPGHSGRARGVPRFPSAGVPPRGLGFTPYQQSRARALLDTAPLVLRDERLAFTLDAWLPLLGDARLVCVFRDPCRAARTLARATGCSPEDALAEWVATYTRILETVAGRDDVLFLDADELFEARGLARLARHVGLEFDGSWVEPGLRHAAAPGALTDLRPSAAALGLFEELCARAGRRATSPTPPDLRVDVVVPILDAALTAVPERTLADHLRTLRQDLSHSRGVRLRVLWIDATLRGLAVLPPRTARRDDPGAVAEELTQRADAPTLASVWRAAQLFARDSPVALAFPGVRVLPPHLVHAASELREGVSVVSADAFLTEASGRLVNRTNPSAMAGTPGPGFASSLVWSKEAFGSIDTTDFRDGILEAWRSLRERGRASHVMRPGVAFDLTTFQAHFPASRADALSLHGPRQRGKGGSDEECPPDLTVVLQRSTSGEAPLLRSLLALGRQSLAPSRFEVLVVDTHGTAARLTRVLQPAFTLRTLDRSSMCDRSRGTGLQRAEELARGEVLVVLGDSVEPDPGLLEAHLVAQSAHPGPCAPCIGTSRPPEGPVSALEEWIQRTEHPEAELPKPLQLALAGSVSLRRSLLRRLGGFASGTGLHALARTLERAEQCGFRPVPLAGARTIRARGLSLHALAQDLLGETLPGELEASALEELGQLELESFGSLDETARAFARRVRDTLARELPAWVARCMEAWADRGSEGVAQVPAPRQQSAASPPAAPELTVIVPTCDRPAELTRLLQALASQDLDPRRFEVFVVDDSGRATAKDTLAEVSVPFALEVLAQPGKGPGAARNLALRSARGQRVLFLNDDAVPDPLLLSRHLLHARAFEDPVALLGSFTLLPRHRRHSVGEYVERTTALFAQPAMKPGIAYHGLSFCTGNISVRRELIETAGGFDESLPYPGGEDSELGLRLEREHGARVVFDPTLRCGHDHAIDAASILRRKRSLGWTLVRIQEKHGDLGLLPLPAGTPWPLPPDLVDRIEEEALRRSHEVDQLVRQLDALCMQEVRAGCGPRNIRAIEKPFAEAQRLATLRGIVDASRGRPPLDPHPQPRGALPVASRSSVRMT